jgi:group I intron endonuclease
MAFIYKITNPNGRIYIGQTTNIKSRLDKYKKLHCKDQPSLYASLLKHTPENHIFEIIEKCSESKLDEREIYWGEYYDVLSNKHLNNRLGRGFGSYDSEETKIKKRKCHKGRSNYWLKGKTLSKDHRNKISKSKKGISNIITKTRKDKGLSKTYHVKAVIKAKSIPLLQYDKDMNFIKEWPSGAVAAKELGLNQSNIHSACVGKTKSCGNFIWVKKETTL